jgi:hydroxylaminobenzene mutase
VPILANPRMGVSSHIEGELIGMLLIILGLIWNKVQLTDKWLKITYWSALYGTFMNWFGILVAAIFNSGKMLVVMAEGKEGTPVVEAFIGFSLISLSIAMILVSINILIGLRKHMKSIY